MKKRSFEYSNNLLQTVAVGVCAGVGVILIGAILITVFINNNTIDLNNSAMWILCLLFGGALITAFTSGRIMKGKYAVVSILSIAAQWILMLVGSLLLSSGFETFWSNTITILLGGILGCVLCLIADRNKKSSRNTLVKLYKKSRAGK